MVIEVDGDGGAMVLFTAAGEFLPEPVEPSPDQPVARAIQASLSADVFRLFANEPAAARFEPEGVHEMRRSARRLRADLRAFRPLLDASRAESLEDDLRWLGRALGAVRDLDVIPPLLHASAADLEANLEPLFRGLADRQEEARARLRQALQGELYRSLRARLIEATRQPPVADGADEQCGRLLPELAARVWKRLKKVGRGLDADAPDELFHEARKRAKDTRYAVEAIAPWLPSKPRKNAERFGDHLAKLLKILGEFQDAVVARQWIEQIVASAQHNGPFPLTAGRLVERQHRVARKAREDFLKAWESFDRAKRRRWMKAGG
jgi:CHAD domain-containing protein